MALELLDSDDDRMFLLLGAISCGSPAENPGEITPIKLLEYLTGDSSGVIVLISEGDSMFPDIGDGDAVICNTNRKPEHGKRIVALVRGEYTLKRFEHSCSGLRLVASNGKFAPRQITEKDDFEIVGVISHVIKKI